MMVWIPPSYSYLISVYVKIDISLRSKRFCAVYEQRTRNESQLPREKWGK